MIDDWKTKVVAIQLILSQQRISYCFSFLFCIIAYCCKKSICFHGESLHKRIIVAFRTIIKFNSHLLLSDKIRRMKKSQIFGKINEMKPKKMIKLLTLLTLNPFLSFLSIQIVLIKTQVESNVLLNEIECDLKKIKLIIQLNPSRAHIDVII